MFMMHWGSWLFLLVLTGLASGSSQRLVERPTSCAGLADGMHTIHPLGADDPLRLWLRCSNGWAILDTSAGENDEAQWRGLFRGGSLQRYGGGSLRGSGLLAAYPRRSDKFPPFYGPRRADLVRGRYASFGAWLRLPRSVQLTTVPDCRAVPGSSGGGGGATGATPPYEVYYATGNFANCNYANTRCDMEPQSQQCEMCDAAAAGGMGAAPGEEGAKTAGTCTHLALHPYTHYAWATPHHDCSHMWNRLPSLGAAGRFCVAYRPGDASDGVPGQAPAVRAAAVRAAAAAAGGAPPAEAMPMGGAAASPPRSSPPTATPSPTAFAAAYRPPAPPKVPLATPGAPAYSDCARCQDLFDQFLGQVRRGEGACGAQGEGAGAAGGEDEEFGCPDGCQAVINAVFGSCIGTVVTFNGRTRGFCEDAGFGNLLGVSIMRKGGPACLYAGGRVQCSGGPWCNTRAPTPAPTGRPTGAPTPQPVLVPTPRPTPLRLATVGLRKPRGCTMSDVLFAQCAKAGGCCRAGGDCSLDCAAAEVEVPTPPPPVEKPLELSALRCGAGDRGAADTCSAPVRHRCPVCCDDAVGSQGPRACLLCVSLRCGGAAGRPHRGELDVRAHPLAMAPPWLHLTLGAAARAEEAAAAAQAEQAKQRCPLGPWRRHGSCSARCGPGTVLEVRDLSQGRGRGLSGCKRLPPSSPLRRRTSPCNDGVCEPAVVGSSSPLLEGLRCGFETMSARAAARMRAGTGRPSGASTLVTTLVTTLGTGRPSGAAAEASAEPGVGADEARAAGGTGAPAEPHAGGGASRWQMLGTNAVYLWVDASACMALWRAAADQAAVASSQQARGGMNGQRGEDWAAEVVRPQVVASLVGEDGGAGWEVAGSHALVYDVGFEKGGAGEGEEGTAEKGGRGEGEGGGEEGAAAGSGRDAGEEEDGGAGKGAGHERVGFRVVVVHPRLRGVTLLRRAAAAGWRVSWLGEASRRAGSTVAGSTGWRHQASERERGSVPAKAAAAAAAAAVAVGAPGVTVFADVDTSASGFGAASGGGSTDTDHGSPSRLAPPHYFASLRGPRGLLTARAWGAHVVYRPTARGFRTYVVYERPITGPKAEALGWVVSWLAVPGTDAAAGRTGQDWHVASGEAQPEQQGVSVLGLFQDVSPLALGTHFRRPPSLITSISTGSLMHWHVRGEAAVFGAGSLFPASPKLAKLWGGAAAISGGAFRLYLHHARFPSVAKLYDWRVHYVGYDGAVPCAVAPWGAWMPCSVTCGGGKRSRVRAITRPPTSLRFGLGVGSDTAFPKAADKDTILRKAWGIEAGKCPALHQQAACGVAGCAARPCVLSAWGSWSTCTVSCAARGDGGGMQHASRSVTTKQAFGGAACGALARQRVCNAFGCPVDCEHSKWGTWGACLPLPLPPPAWEAEAQARAAVRAARGAGAANGGATPLKTPLPVPVGRWACARGEKLRTRAVLVKPAHGGAPCPALHSPKPCVPFAACAGAGRSRLCGDTTAFTVVVSPKSSAARQAEDAAAKATASRAGTARWDHEEEEGRAAAMLGLVSREQEAADAREVLGRASSRGGVQRDWGWRRFGSDAIYMDVNTSACGFGAGWAQSATPARYAVSVLGLDGVPFFEMMRGSVSLLRATPTSFRVLLWVPALRARYGLRYAAGRGSATGKGKPWRVAWVAEVGRNSGSTLQGASGWKSMGPLTTSAAADGARASTSASVSLHVSTARATFFPAVPRYFPMLVGTRLHWRAEGAGIVRGASSSGFSTYLTVTLPPAAAERLQLAAAAAVSKGKRANVAVNDLVEAWGWSVSWIGLGQREDHAHSRLPTGRDASGIAVELAAETSGAPLVNGVSGASPPGKGWQEGASVGLSGVQAGSSAGGKALWLDVDTLMMGLFPSPEPVYVASLTAAPECALCWAPVGLSAVDKVQAAGFKFYQVRVSSPPPQAAVRLLLHLRCRLTHDFPCLPSPRRGALPLARQPL
jgi:hypothetical protein